MSLKYKTLWLLIGYCMVLFVVYASLMSEPVGLGVQQSDKILHLIGYFGLMGWFIQIYQQKKVRRILLLAFITMGISLEFLQDLGGVRHFEVNDMLANSAGVLLAWLLVNTPFSRVLFWFEKRFLSSV